MDTVLHGMCLEANPRGEGSQSEEKASAMSKLLSVQFSYDGSITEPVSLSDMKEYLRIDFDDDDTLITSMITTARMACEKYLGMVLVDTTVKAYYKNGGDLIQLMYGPIKETDGMPVIISGAKTDDEITGNGNQVWLACTGDRTLTYDSGWSDVPEWARLAIMQQVAWNYEHRGDESIAPGRIAPDTAVTLFPYRMTLHEFLL